MFPELSALCGSEVLPVRREVRKETEVFVPVSVWMVVNVSVMQKSPFLSKSLSSSIRSLS